MDIKITNHGIVFGLSMFIPVMQYLAHQKANKKDITLDEVFENLKNKMLSDLEKLNKDKSGITMQDIEIISTATKMIPNLVKVFENGYEDENT